MGCRLVQAATLAAFIHIVFTSEVIAQDPTDLDKEDVPGRMLTALSYFFMPMQIRFPKNKLGCPMIKVCGRLFFTTFVMRESRGQP